MTGDRLHVVGDDTDAQRIERVEAFCKAWHDTYSAKAPEHGFDLGIPAAWEDLPPRSRELVRAIVAELDRGGYIK